MNSENSNNQEELERGFLSKLPALLRFTGAGALVLATITFLVQTLDFESPFSRIINFAYLLLAVLGLGILCKFIVQEDKSAKIGMGIALGMIPVIGLQLGAVIYASVVTIAREYPKYLSYYGFQSNEQILWSLIGVLLFSGLTLLSIRILAIDKTSIFSKFYLLGILVIMLPFRGNLTSFLLAGALLAICIYLERVIFQKGNEYQSKEICYLRLLLFVPALIILFRNIVLYSEGSISLGLIFAAFALIFGFVTSSLKSEYYHRSKVIASICTFIAWFLFSGELSETYFDEYRYYIIILPVTLYLLNLRERFQSSSALMIFLANVSFIYLITAQQTINGDLIDTTLSLMVCVLGIGYAWINKYKGTLTVTGITLVLLLTKYCDYLIELYQLNPWMFLGIGGVVTILLAALLEKNIIRIKGWFSKF